MAGRKRNYLVSEDSPSFDHTNLKHLDEAERRYLRLWAAFLAAHLNDLNDKFSTKDRCIKKKRRREKEAAYTWFSKKSSVMTTSKGNYESISLEQVCDWLNINPEKVRQLAIEIYEGKKQFNYRWDQ